jgi:lysophospholipase L1-like esterase
MSKALGSDFYVIEEGLPGRTTVWDDPIEGDRNGKIYLPPCLESHSPIDLVILMLGTNDLKRRFSVPASDIAASAGTLVGIIQKSQAGQGGVAPLVLLIAPPVIGPLSELAEMFGSDAIERSQKFAAYYREVAADRQTFYLNAAEYVVSSPLDGIHFDAAQHARLGAAVAIRVKEIFQVKVNQAGEK